MHQHRNPDMMMKWKAILFAKSLCLACLPLLVFPVEGSAQQAPSPCPTDSAYRAFDFWLGEWIVETADGTKAGENSITRQTNGCMLQENWTSASGSSGQSINYYDPSDSLWHQVWVDVAGNIGYFAGELEDGNMVLK